MSDYERTYASLFLLPMIGIPFGDMKRHFYNIYVRDNSLPEYDCHLFLVLEASARDDKHLIDELVKKPHFVEAYKPVSSKTVYVFSVPAYFQHDYEMFLAGKYSRFSEPYKTLVVNILPPEVTKPGYAGRYYMAYKALYPDLQARERLAKALKVRLGPELPKDCEIYPLPNMERETLFSDKLISVLA
jgi:hypothetical protein